MKRIEKFEMVKKPIIKFIAEDGTEFDHESACKEYEHAKAIIISSALVSNLDCSLWQML